MKNRANSNENRMIFPSTKIKKIIKKLSRLNEIFLTLLTKAKTVQMNVNHNLQHDSKSALGLTLLSS